MQAKKGKEKNRWLFLDLIRVLAILMMIQGHVFEAYLNPAEKAFTWFRWHDLVHGLTGPIFLFSAGISFGFTTIRKIEEYTSLTRKFYARLRRYLILILIGYLLHSPDKNINYAIQHLTTATERQFAMADALHCIGVTLILVQIGVFFLKELRYIRVFLWASGLFFMLGMLYTWTLDFTGHSPWLVAYLSKQFGSIYPLFPWASFVMYGILTGDLLLRAIRNISKEQILRLLLSISGGLILISLPGFLRLLETISEITHLMFLESLYLGIILGILALFFALDKYYIANVNLNTFGINFWKLVRIMGQESLFIYVVHLAIIYGTAWNRPLLEPYKQNFGISQSILIFIVYLAILLLMTLVWKRIKLYFGLKFWLNKFRSSNNSG
jgi:uncharacterized membrane protein